MPCNTANMEQQTDIISLLENKKVKPTANRILVLKGLLSSSRPMSLSDIEDALPTMDKSSIFRVLSLFLERDIVHAFEDGRGVVNYEMCESKGSCNHKDSHIHFYCESCHRSFCMEDLHIPSFRLPEGFRPSSISFVIKGLCPECGRKDSFSD